MLNKKYTKENNILGIVFNMIKLYLYIIVLLVLVYLVLDYLISNPIYCIDGVTENALLEAKKAANEVAKNATLNVNSPNVKLGQPNFNVPAEAFTNLGIGGAVSAGIYSMAKSKRIGALPVGGKAATIFVGGFLGGAAFFLLQAQKQ